ncbi:unnamed protein product [Zymoseptoria tritici ST99CH_1A5]|uniref:Hydrophobin n=2 Tax=Zymoseptoria tritici TaxID=1047171 RepID=A0A1X7RLK3_ZYMT9|nr:unnamed protein product [Zymoseptoria tritici ST99CH_3D7]SMR48080.1 unnamed protein product [Zymoseptoria tritici ST99CH_3D1]SMY21990.1 unnamed protein product [Zymoseptoria tritici ST99CH_1A5]
MKAATLIAALFAIADHVMADDICCVSNYDPSQGRCAVGIPACCDGRIRKHPKCATATLGEIFFQPRDQTGPVPGGGNPSQCTPGGRQGEWWCVHYP